MKWFFLLEIIGTISFAVSGAMVAIKKKVDIFGVLFLGIITAFGGGLTRDVILSNTPPTMFRNTTYIIFATVASLLVYLTASFFKDKYIQNELLIDTINNIFDAIGLGAFSVIGAQLTIQLYKDAGTLLIVIMGMITGIGGGILRDLLVREIPFVLKKRVYAIAAICGATIYYILIHFTSSWLAMIIGVFTTFSLRMLSTVFKWNLPKAIE